MSERGRVVRWCPDRAFPPYAFVPGRTPHPVRDPRGHSYDPRGESDARLPRVAPERWREDEAWLFGVDLYNHGYAWEAHESWERRWLAPHDDAQERFVQALIQVAASVLKVAMGEPHGADSLARRALEALDEHRDLDARALLGRIEPHGRPESTPPSRPERYMGLDVRAFAAAFRAWSLDEARTFEQRPRLDLA